MRQREYTDYMDAARQREHGATDQEIAARFHLPNTEGVEYMVWFGEQLLLKNDARYELPRFIADTLIKNNLDSVAALRQVLADGGPLRYHSGPLAMEVLQTYLRKSAATTPVVTDEPNPACSDATDDDRHHRAVRAASTQMSPK